MRGSGVIIWSGRKRKLDFVFSETRVVRFRSIWSVEGEWRNGVEWEGSEAGVDRVGGERVRLVGCPGGAVGECREE
jgi:hypothetical protein